MNELLVGEAETLREITRVFPLPRDYLVVDIETSGFSKNKDLIVAASWGEVKDKVPGACTSVILDWTRTMCVDPGRLRGQLGRIAMEFAQSGRRWYYPIERLMAEGVEPFQGLHQFVVMLHNALVSRTKIVGHNFIGFDFPFVAEACARFVPNYSLPWCADAVYDTAVLEKALLLGRPPWLGESLEDWQTRVHHMAVKKGQKFNLSGHCVDKYHLVQRFNLDMSAAHKADFDILLCHHLFETYRAMAENRS